MKTYVKYSLIAWMVFTILVGWVVFAISDIPTALVRVTSFVIPAMTLFYLNLLWLSRKYLEQKKIRTYAGFVAALVLLHIFVMAPIDIYFDQNYELKIPHYKDRPIWIAYFGRMMGSIPPLVISALLWKSMQLQKEREGSLVLKHQVSEAELRALRAQINPHFLFNSLNNIYSLSQMKSDNTGDAILQLSEILRFVTYESDKDFVNLNDELKQIDNFLQLQFLKVEDHDNVRYNISESPNHLRIAPMLLLPFIENSFKHSNFENKEKGWINIDLHVEGDHLLMVLENSASISATKKDQTGGVGMENVKKRLSLIYPEKHDLTIKQNRDGYHVKLEIDLSK